MLSSGKLPLLSWSKLDGLEPRRHQNQVRVKVPKLLLSSFGIFFRYFFVFSGANLGWGILCFFVIFFRISGTQGFLGSVPPPQDRKLRWIQECFKGGFLSQHLSPIQVPFFGRFGLYSGGLTGLNSDNFCSATPTFGLQV